MLALLTTDFLGVVGLMAIATAVAVEVLKQIPYVNKVPSELLAIIMAIICNLCYTIYSAGQLGVTLGAMDYLLIVASGITTAFVAMFGWEKLNELINKNKQPEE